MSILLKTFNWTWLGLILGLLLLTTLGIRGWQFWQYSQQEAKQTILESQTAPVVRQDLIIQVSATGSIKPITPVNISPKQPGRLVKLYVDQGDRVTAGQVLAQMDDTDLQGQLLQAEGRLAEVEANLRKLEAGNRPEEIQQAEQDLQEAKAEMIAIRSTHESNLALYRNGAISRNTLDSSRSQYEVAQARINRSQQQLDLLRAGFRQEDIDATRAQVLQAQGALKTIQTQINDMVIKAPFSGMITQKYADVGAFVTPTTSASATSSATSSSILALANDLEAVANVSETDVRNIHVGQTVELRVEAYPNRIFQGQVRLIAPESVVVQNVTSFEVRIKLLDDSKQQLKSGMNLTADFLVGQHKAALLIPTTAIVSQTEGTGVYLLQSDGESRFHPIRVGATVGSQTEVLSGLTQDDRVFITFPGQRQPNARPVQTSPFGPPSGSGARSLR